MRLAAILAALLFTTNCITPEPSTTDRSTFQKTKAKAEQGDAQAQTRLGSLYRIGKGVPENDAEAVKWFRKAAEQGFPPAEYFLGSALRSGEGVPQNRTEGVAWIRKSAEHGVPGAQVHLGMMLTVENQTESAEWYRRAAEQGDVTGQMQLGIGYAAGAGVQQNNIQAHAWLNVASANGSSASATFRDRVAERMTPDQIAEAQKLAAEYFEKYKAE